MLRASMKSQLSQQEEAERLVQVGKWHRCLNKGEGMDTSGPSPLISVGTRWRCGVRRGQCASQSVPSRVGAGSRSWARWGWVGKSDPMLFVVFSNSNDSAML